MRTDELVQALAADNAVRAMPLGRYSSAALLAGFAVTAAMFAALLGPRNDLTRLFVDVGLLMKFLLPLLLGAAAGGLVLRLMRPEVAAGRWSVALAIAPALLAVNVLIELFSVPPAQWWERAVGVEALVCLIAIPLLSLPILVGGLLALRHGAPTHTRLAGTAAGLLAGGLAATLYASYCINESALYLATWYSLAIMLVALVGAVLGSRLLRW